jgi:hypothetical protein
MYDFVSGPLVWIAFIGFFGGLFYRFVTMARLAKKDKVVYPTFDAKYGLRSLLHWVIPFAGVNMNTLLSYAFHFCLLVTPLFLMGHAVLWQESWGIRWWSLPKGVADIMTLVVIFACIFFIIRRLVRPEVRNVSYPSDFLLALLPARSAGDGAVCDRLLGPPAVVALQTDDHHPRALRGPVAAAHTVDAIGPHDVVPVHAGLHGQRIRRGAPLEGLVRYAG